MKNRKPEEGQRSSATVNFGLGNRILTELPNFKALKETDVLWRFLSIEKFLLMMSSRSLWFARYDTFEDKYEGNVPRHWKNKTEGYGRNLELGYISSWYRGEHEPINMWMNYGGQRNTAICIKSDAGKLKSSLENALTPNGLPFNIDPVSYFNFDDQNINKPQWLTLNGREEQGGFYLGKRINFEHENEVRAYFIDPLHNQYPDEGGILGVNNIQEILLAKKLGYSIDVNLNELISDVLISPYADEGIIPSLRVLLNSNGINAEIVKSTILEPDANE